MANQENTIIEVPYIYLAACVQVAAVSDVRFYLMGVKIGNGIVAGTNGHCAVIVQDENLKDIPEMIIPRDEILWLMKKVGVKHFLTDIVTIEKIKGDTISDNSYIMSIKTHRTSAYEVFNPIEGEFPDVMRVLKIPEESQNVAPMFQIDYLKTMAKVKQILTGSKIGGINVLFNGSNEVMYFPLGEDRYHGLVMPMRI